MDCGAAKLTDQEVREIRASDDTQHALADKYNVNQSTISKVRRRRTWRTIE
tara:strand:+ start:413 stop:565 length:153 start_codon:yes stop_codon:yes gene_type:complete